MNCSKISKLLPLYISDDLDGSELAGVEAHLGTCLNCYREYQGHLKSLRALKQLGEKPDLSRMLAGFPEGVMQRVAREPKGPAAPVPKVVYAFLPRTLAAAALLVAALTAFYFFTGGDDAPDRGGSGLQDPTTPVTGEPRLDDGSLKPLGPEELERRLETLKLHLPEVKVQPVDFRNF